jgi:hypothetical protein
MVVHNLTAGCSGPVVALDKAADTITVSAFTGGSRQNIMNGDSYTIEVWPGLPYEWNGYTQFYTNSDRTPFPVNCKLLMGYHYKVLGDNCACRIELLNGSTYATANHNTIMPMSYWSAGLILAPLRKQSHASYSGLRPFVTLADNTTRLSLGTLP